LLATLGSALTYGTAPLRGTFSDEGFAEAFLRMERALLQVLEELGLVPAGEAAKLDRFRIGDFDLAAASEVAQSTGNPVAGLVEQIYQCSPYAHFGITANDAWDVAHVLQLKAAITLILADVRIAVEQLTTMVEAHAKTPMVARTQGQAGAPTTLGFKLATWLDELLRIAARLAKAMDEAALVSVAGVVGTASSFAVIGASPEAVEAGTARELGLRVSAMPWFTSRDRFVALASALAQLCTFAGKVGHEVYNLQRSGIEELSEGGAYGSSATPQKSNPWISQRMHGLAVVGRHLSSMVADGAALAEGEREIGTMYAEWYGLAHLCLVSGRVAADLAQVAGRLEVHEDVMLANLQRDPSLLSESMSMVLSRAVGKKRGYGLMKAAMARYRAGQAYPAAVSEAFRQAGLDAPNDPAQWRSALGRASSKSHEVVAAARRWLKANPESIEGAGRNAKGSGLPRGARSAGKPSPGSRGRSAGRPARRAKRRSG